MAPMNDQPKTLSAPMQWGIASGVTAGRGMENVGHQPQRLNALRQNGVLHQSELPQ